MITYLKNMATRAYQVYKDTNVQKDSMINKTVTNEKDMKEQSSMKWSCPYLASKKEKEVTNEKDVKERSSMKDSKIEKTVTEGTTVHRYPNIFEM